VHRRSGRSALRDPEHTTKFWYTKSTGKMVPGAKLHWDWEMYGASSEVTVDQVDEHRSITFSWSGYDPGTRRRGSSSGSILGARM
jgi:hypothetical protein